jgi:hypothetical protein
VTNSTPTSTEAERNASTPHSHASRESLEELGVSAEQGLDTAEAKKRLEEAGPNALARDSRRGIPRLLWRQINDPLTALTGRGSGYLADDFSEKHHRKRMATWEEAITRYLCRDVRAGC